VISKRQLDRIMNLPAVKSGKVRIELDACGFLIRRGPFTEVVPFRDACATTARITPFRMAVRRVGRPQASELA
jgi:hypothetical protein